MQVAKSVDGYTDVVVGVNWQVTGTDGTYSFRVAATSPVGSVDPSDFTPYGDLTEAQVLAWIPDPCSVAVQACIENNINSQVISISQMTPPWA
jgi:hypothetical protein